MTHKPIKDELTITWNTKCSCYGFNLPARVSCPGVEERMKDPRAICNFCYAHASCWQFKKPKEIIYRNLKYVTTHPAPEINAALLRVLNEIPDGQNRYFRFFGSGDIVNKELMDALYKTAWDMPHIKMWVPTQNLEAYAILTSVYRLPPNLTVRLTAMRVNDPAPGIGLTTYTDTCPPRHYPCPGECEGCRVCWDKPKVPVAFKMHGSAITMAKLRRARELGKW